VVKDKSRSKRSDICEMVIMNDWLFGWKELVIQMVYSLGDCSVIIYKIS
jgi:hypothetical protein